METKSQIKTKILGKFHVITYGKLCLFDKEKNNRPFPICPLPQFQNESSCKTIQMKMSLICMTMGVQVKPIFI